MSAAPAQDVGANLGEVATAWERALSRAELEHGVAVARLEATSPETLADVLLDLDARRRLVARGDVLAREREQLDRLQTDVGAPAIGLALHVVAVDAAASWAAGL